MDARIRRVIDLIKSRPGQSLTTKVLSKEATLSVTQFHRLFKNETGLTPASFVEQTRMKLAHEQIMTNGKGVLELASSLNYENYETFSRAFKKHFKLSPDDLKAIAAKAKQLVGQEAEVFVATMSDDEDLLTNLSKMIYETNVSPEDLKGAKVFRIVPGHGTSDMSIKKKYVMQSDSGLTKYLIQLSDDNAT